MLKPLLTFFLFSFVALAATTTDAAESRKASGVVTAASDLKIKQIAPEDDDLAEEWARVTEEESLRGVSAALVAESGGTWEVTVAAAEQVRSESLESEFFAAVTKALVALPGVTRVVQEDRELWVVDGKVSGEALIRACAAVIDRYADAIRAEAAR